MKTKILLLVPILFFIHSLKSQSWDWKKPSAGNSLIMDLNNNVYSFSGYNVGWYSPQNGFTITKMDANGQVLWTKTSNAGDLTGYKIDTQNNLIIIGNLTSHMIFGSANLYPTGETSFFIIRMSPGGAILNSNVYGSTKQTFVKDIFITQSGDYLIGGGYKGSFVINGFNIVSNDTLINAFLVRLDTLQQVVWAESSTFISGGDYASVEEIVETTSGKYYMTLSAVDGLVSFNGDTAEYSGKYLYQLNANRQVNWTSYLAYPGESYTDFVDLKTAGDTAYMKGLYGNPHGSWSVLEIITPSGIRSSIYTYDYGFAFEVANGKVFYTETHNVDPDLPGQSYCKFYTTTLSGAKINADSMAYNGGMNFKDLAVFNQGQWYLSGQSDTGFFAGKINLSPASGMPEYGNDISFSVFPNPAKNTIQIKTVQPFDHYSLQVTDQMGRTVLYKKNNTTGSQALDVSELSRGIYFLKLFNQQLSQVSKIVIE